VKTWSRATEPYESCQVRKEAAISRQFCVTRGNLVGSRQGALNFFRIIAIDVAALMAFLL